MTTEPSLLSVTYQTTFSAFSQWNSDSGSMEWAKQNVANRESVNPVNVVNSIPELAICPIQSLSLSSAQLMLSWNMFGGLESDHMVVLEQTE